jgi:hypothetical protein
MAIYKLLERSAFEPDDIQRMASAYEEALFLLGLKYRTDPLTETVARHIFDIAQTGEKDPDLICAFALRRMGIPPKASTVP